MITARRIILGILIAAIGTAAFRLSFDAQYTLVTHIARMSPTIAWLYPLVVDAFIITTVLTAWWANKPTPWQRTYPWLAMALFSAISISGNSLKVLTIDHLQNPRLAVAIYTVPPIALLIATHLATSTVFKRPATPATPAKNPPRSRQPRVAAERTEQQHTDIPVPSEVELLAMADEGKSMQQIADTIGRSKSWVGKTVKDARDRRLSA